MIHRTRWACRHRVVRGSRWAACPVSAIGSRCERRPEMHRNERKRPAVVEGETTSVYHRANEPLLGSRVVAKKFNGNISVKTGRCAGERGEQRGRGKHFRPPRRSRKLTPRRCYEIPCSGPARGIPDARIRKAFDAAAELRKSRWRSSLGSERCRARPPTTGSGAGEDRAAAMDVEMLPR